MAPQDGTTKIFVGNLPETCRKAQLQALFEKYGKVAECDIVKNYGFVHFYDAQDAKAAVANLDGIAFEGVNIRVEISHSKVRQKPGMGGKGECFRCGREGHWSKACPRAPGPREYGGLSSNGGPTGDPYSDPYRSAYADQYYRDRFLPPPVDRFRPYPDPYERRPPPPPLPPRDPYFRDRVDPYARPPPEYYGRRSPPRDPYYSDYYRRSYPTMGPLPPQPGRASPLRSRVPGPY